MVSGENINISKYDIESSLEAVNKLVKSKLYADAEELLKQIIQNCPYDYRGWFEYSKFDYHCKEVWLDDNSDFIKAKALADDSGLAEIISYRDSEYKEIVDRCKTLNDFLENIDYESLNFSYIKLYDIEQGIKHKGYLGLEVIQEKIMLVQYVIDKKYGFIRYGDLSSLSNPVTIKRQLKDKKFIGKIIDKYGRDVFRSGIRCSEDDNEEYFNSNKFGSCLYISDILENRVIFNNQKSEMYYGDDLRKKSTDIKYASRACYIATCVYGSYDCPQVWTLRRFRDYTLDVTWYGKAFIKCYYAISPILVKWFGETRWFKSFWKSRLDKMVSKLNNKGVDNTYYHDKY